jgi:hypothetical protein
VLKGLIGKPLRWKVHQLGAKPRRLEYYFLRSSFDPQDVENLQNVEGHTVHAPPDCVFDHDMKLELVVAEDGTARRKFIYKTGRTEEDIIASEGKPFYLDMTYGQEAPVPTACIGLDFGTSNTSVSFVDRTCIQVCQKRASDKTWCDLSNLAQTLPYPLAAPLASFLTETDEIRLVRRGTAFIESALAMAAYVCYLEFCTQDRRYKSQLFKAFSQRSAGPLWAMLKQALEKLPKDAQFSSRYRDLLSQELFKPVNGVVDFIAQAKHQKASSFDTKTPVEILANVSQRVFDGCLFGMFEDTKRKPFAATFEGRFREATGRPPFVRCWIYRGTEYFAEQEPYLVDAQKGIALSLAPLFFWKFCDAHPDADCGHCYVFDIPSRSEGAYSFKAVGYPCACEIAIDGDYGELARKLGEFRQSDPMLKLVHVGELQEV